MIPIQKFATALVLVALVGTAVHAAPTDDLRAVLDDAARWRFDEEPVLATVVGVPGYDDKLRHLAPADITRLVDRGEALRKRLAAIPVAALSEREKLWRDSLTFILDSELENLRSDAMLLPFNQMDGSHLIAQMVAIQPHHTVADLEAWSRRMGELPRVFDEEIAMQRRGIEKHIVPPRWCVEQLIAQVKGLSSKEALRRAFLGELATDLAALPAADRERVSRMLEATVDGKLLPAYLKLGRFFSSDLLPHARDTDGFWALPGGDQLYAAAVRNMTTTRQTASALHTIGEQEVARLEMEMSKIARARGAADLASYQKALAADAAQHPKDGATLLSTYKRYSDAYVPMMAKQFGRLPKAGLDVRPVEEFRAEHAAGAEYRPGSPDGKRPGQTVVNTFKAAERGLWDVQATAYHEGAPGHHLQLMITMEDGELPVVLRTGFMVAYVEGWALYAESLPEELGLYKEPASIFGRLDSERFRAVRLVVDTGLHEQHWTREQARTYMRAHTAMSDADLRAEVDRYISWPAQALGYKVGQLKLRELRKRAEQKLGKRFDLRAFHDAVLIGGQRPLSALEASIDRYIATH
jgi:uncharacterized protein (DUF885 family)